MKRRLAPLTLLLMTCCGSTGLSNVSPHPLAAPGVTAPLRVPDAATPRLGPFAGAGSGVRRIDVAQR